MSAVSSRGHFICIINIESTAKTATPPSAGESEILRSRLTLIDMAGSERLAKTGVSGMQLVESSKINKSMATLSRVIASATDRTPPKKHIPYRYVLYHCYSIHSNRYHMIYLFYIYILIDNYDIRDSQLTRIMQDSLGGNAKTVMIVNCSPAGEYYNETLSSLRLGERAKAIKNNPKINRIFSQKRI